MSHTGYGEYVWEWWGMKLAREAWSLNKVDKRVVHGKHKVDSTAEMKGKRTRLLNYGASM